MHAEYFRVMFTPNGMYKSSEAKLVCEDKKLPNQANAATRRSLKMPLNVYDCSICS